VVRVSVHVRVDEAILKQVDKIAARLGFTRSEAIRDALAIYCRLMEAEFKARKELDELMKYLGRLTTEDLVELYERLEAEIVRRKLR